MGCGKTYFAQKLSQQLCYNFIDLDIVVEQHLNTTTAQTFVNKGEDYFRQIENELLLQQISSVTTSTIFATGGGTPCFFNAIDAMNEAGVTIWLNPSINTIVKNIYSETAKRPLLQNTSEADLKNKLQHILQERKSCYAQSQHQLNDDEVSINNLKKIISQNA